VRNGPVGVIATTMNDAFQTGELVVQDLKSGESLATLRLSGNCRTLVLSLSFSPVKRHAGNACSS